MSEGAPPKRWMVRRAAERFAPRAGFVRDAGSLWGASVAVVATSAVQGVFVARWLGPRGLGLATLLVAYAGGLFTFVGFRSSEASLKYLGEYAARNEPEYARGTAKLTYAADLAVGVVALALLALTSGWAERRVIHSPDLRGMLLLAGVGYLVSSTATTSESILLTLRRFKPLAWVQVSAALVRACLVLVLVDAGKGVRGVIVGTVVGLALEGVMTTLLAAFEVRRTWCGSWRAARLDASPGQRRAIVRFLLWSNYGSFVGLVAKKMDTVIIGFFRGPVDVGYYRLARSLTSLAGSVVGPLQSAIFPRFAALWGAGRRADLERLVRRAATRVGAPLATIAIAGLVLVGPVIRATVGPAYRPAAQPARILLVGTAVWVGLFWLRPALLTIGSVRYYALNSTLGSALALGGSLLLVPAWGALGMAWAQTIASAIATGAALWYFLRSHRARLGPQRPTENAAGFADRGTWEAAKDRDGAR